LFASFLITLREGLEAALIVGIVLSVLRKLERSDRSRPVWLGVGAALVTSVLAALVLNALGVAFEGRGEEIFEGFAMLLAAGVLTWMIFWMQRQGREVQAELERDVRQAVSIGSAWALFSLAFVAVVREGIETVLFLTAAAFTATPAQTLIGGALGAFAASFRSHAVAHDLDAQASALHAEGFRLIPWGLCESAAHLDPLTPRYQVRAAELAAELGMNGVAGARWESLEKRSEEWIVARQALPGANPGQTRMVVAAPRDRFTDSESFPLGLGSLGPVVRPPRP